MKYSNKLLVIMAILFIPIFSFSQKCEVKTDPFNGKKKVTFGSKHKAIYVELNDGIVSWDLDILYKGEYNLKLPKGSKLSFKLENGQDVTLVTDTSVGPISKITGDQVYTSYIPTLTIDKEALDKFSSSFVTLFRYPDMNGGYIDHEIKGLFGKRYWKKFFKAMECIQENYSN